MESIDHDIRGNPIYSPLDLAIQRAPLPVFDSPRPCVSVGGEFLTHGEVESLRCAVTALHSEMSDPLALGDDEHGRFMTKYYRRDMERILKLMGVIK